MSDWLDLPTIGNSAVGSLVAGILLLTAAPWWLKWLKPKDTTKLKEIGKAASVFAFLIGVIVLGVVGLNYLEKESIPPYHPTLSEEEAALAFAECEMKSVEATSDIVSRSSRSSARQRYRAACLISKGFEWDSGKDTE